MGICPVLMTKGAQGTWILSWEMLAFAYLLSTSLFKMQHCKPGWEQNLFKDECPPLLSHLW